MERNQAPLHQKSSSFSPASTRDEKLRDADRNLSLGAIKLSEHERNDKGPGIANEQIKEECEDGEDNNDDGDNAGKVTAGEDAVNVNAGDSGGVSAEKTCEPDLASLSEDIDTFLVCRDGDELPNIPEEMLEKFAAAVEQEITLSEAADYKWVMDANGGQPPLLAALRRIATLSKALTKDAEGKCNTQGAHRVTGVLHRAMAFLEDEFHSLLEDPRVAKVAHPADQGINTGKSTKRRPSFEQAPEPDRCVLPASNPGGAGGEPTPPYSPETVDRLCVIADTLITAGCVTECTQVFLVARRNAFYAALLSLGYEKVGIDNVMRMAWEPLEAEIVSWIKAFRHTINVGLSTEHNLCTRVFAGHHAAVGLGVFADLARCVMLHLLNFTEAVAMTKLAAEKLFKVLDMYEAIRDASPVIDAFLATSTDDSNNNKNTTALTDLKAEIAAVLSRLGESAVAIFCNLDSSIRADMFKQPVPGGAVHPLTRYVMNYLKCSCAYKNTLEQVFRVHHRPDNHTSDDSSANPFAEKLMEVMDLLHGNLEAKSRLYKDPSLSNIFLMNNGRYMLQKIRGSAEVNAVLGEAWARKRSTDLRQYHKNYQRETWSRVLGVLRDDGLLTVKGSVQKPVLKERFKAFNSAFEEIHRTQGAWVVSDEQLQSELRVSIAAVVVPAYRSFLGRFAQHFTPGRQTEKYVKYSAEDVEAFIDDLFDGNATSMARRRT